MAAAVAVLLAGCGGSAGRVVAPAVSVPASLAACPSGEPRVEDAGVWVCDPNVPVTPAPAPAAALSFTCVVTATGGAAPAVQFTVTATDTGTVTADPTTISVVFDDAGGGEVASNPDVSFWEVIPAGQSLTEHLSSEGGPGVTSCSVAGWG